MKGLFWQVYCSQKLRLFRSQIAPNRGEQLQSQRIDGFYFVSQKLRLFRSQIAPNRGEQLQSQRIDGFYFVAKSPPIVVSNFKARGLMVWTVIVIASPGDAPLRVTVQGPIFRG
jgi:hypothetical protein